MKQKSHFTRKQRKLYFEPIAFLTDTLGRSRPRHLRNRRLRRLALHTIWKAWMQATGFQVWERGQWVQIEQFDEERLA